MQLKKRLLCLLLLFCSVMVFAIYPAEIQNYNNAPTLFINNTPVYPMCFRSWPLDASEQAAMCQAINSAGVKIFFVPVHLGKFWTGQGVYNYSELDNAISNITSYAPDAWLIPAISIHHTMNWWYNSNLSERTIDGLDPTSTTPVQEPYACISFASSQFQQEASVAIQKIIQYYANKTYSDKLLGYQIDHGAYGEWIPWGMDQKKYTDFNPQFIAQFRTWLQQKYTSDTELQISWNNPLVTLSTAQPFLGAIEDQYPDNGRFIDPAIKTQLLDSREFLSLLICDNIEFYANFVKQQTNGEALVGLYSGANYQYQHIDNILQNSDIDFVCSSTGYGDRGASGVTYDQGFVLESIKKHGKLYIHDADIRTYLFPETTTVHFGNVTDLGRLSNPYDTIMVLRREWAAMAIHGMGLTWFNILTDPAFNCPIILEDISRMKKAGKALLNFDRESNAEIAVIVKDRSTHHAMFYSQDSIRSQLYRIGAPVDIYTIEDAQTIQPGAYKLIVVILSQRLSSAERSTLNGLKSNGTAILWSMGTGYLDTGGFSLQRMNELAGCVFSRQIGTLPQMRLNPGATFITMQAGDEYNLQGLITGQTNSGFFTMDGAPNLIALGHTRSDYNYKIVFAKILMGSWTSYVYPGYIVPGDIIREIALNHGVHIYNYDDNGFYANKHLLVVSSGEGKIQKQIKLPAYMDVYDIFNQQAVATGVNEFTVEMPAKTTNVYFVGTTAEVSQFIQYYSN